MVFGTDEGIYYFPMLEDYYWSVLCQGVAFGNTQNPYLLDSGAYTVLDTGTSHLFLPASLYDIYLQHIIWEAGGPKFFVEQG